MRDRLIKLLDIIIQPGEKTLGDIADHLLSNGVTVPRDNFTFDYGTVTFKHRFSINRSLDDYKETTLDKCISMSIVYKYSPTLIEMQILYKDENGKLQCLRKDLHDYTFEIKHKGDMKISL